jgi:hypothetical protein
MRPSDRLGVHGWLYYHAAFSARFVESVLNTMKLGPEGLILDPFVGCGTTSFVAKSLGIPSVGVELNPTAYYVSRAKVGSEPDLIRLERALGSLRGRLPKVEPTEEYAKWFHQEDRALEQTLQLGQAIVERTSDESLRDFLIAALLLSLRRVAKVTRSSNPTWILNSKHPSKSLVNPYRALREQTKSMYHDLMTAIHSPETRADILFDNSTTVRFKETFDAIVTSPPYLTRIDYIVNFRMENDFLGNLKLPNQFDIPSLRDAMIGTVTIPSKTLASRDPDSAWGPTCVNVLGEVRNHPTKAASSYYYPTIYNYFDNMHKWLIRVHDDFLKPSGLLFIVVQTSYFKDVEIAIGDILLEMGKIKGFTDALKIRHESVHAPPGILYEDVLLFVN